MNSRLRLLAWQIDVIAHEQSERREAHDDCARGHMEERQGGGPQNRYEGLRLSPRPNIVPLFRRLFESTLAQRPTPRTLHIEEQAKWD